VAQWADTEADTVPGAGTWAQDDRPSHCGACSSARMHVCVCLCLIGRRKRYKEPNVCVCVCVLICRSG
jgi:hypothetical protein